MKSVDDKVVALEEAMKLVVHGDTVAFGGMTLYRRPMAAVRQIVRQSARDLTLLSLMGSIEADLLIGAGCISRVRSGYLGMEFLGAAPNFRRFAEQGKGQVQEETELTIIGGLRAELMEVPFLPIQGLLETDILTVRKDLKEVTCPYTGQRLIAVPAIRPDVAIIHAQAADRSGNACLDGELSIDKELSKAARKVIITTERLVETEDLARSPGQVHIVSFLVDAVVWSPFGAHPTSCYPYYTYDLPHLQEYLRAAASEEGFKTYLERYVLGPRMHEDYLEEAGGARLLTQIQL